MPIDVLPSASLVINDLPSNDNCRTSTRRVLCDERLETIIGPLLSAQAGQLQEASVDLKCEWFRKCLAALASAQEDNFPGDVADDTLPLVVNRHEVLQSVCKQMEGLVPAMEESAVTFESENGEGVGVLRELIALFTHEFANQNYNLFVTTDSTPPRLALSSRPWPGTG